MGWARWVPEPDAPPDEAIFRHLDVDVTLRVVDDDDGITHDVRVDATDEDGPGQFTFGHRSNGKLRMDAAGAVPSVLLGRPQGWMEQFVLLAEYAERTLLAYPFEEERVGLVAHDRVGEGILAIGIVDPASLATELLAYSRSLAESLVGEDDRFERIHRDGRRALEHYREHGDLSEFAFERSDSAIDAYLFTYQSVDADVRTGQVIRDGDHLADRVQELFDVPEDPLAEKRFVDLLYDNDDPWVRRRTLSILAESPDERSTNALWLLAHDLDRVREEQLPQLFRVLSELAPATAGERLAMLIRDSPAEMEQQVHAVESLGTVSTPLTKAALNHLDGLAVLDRYGGPTDELREAIERTMATSDGESTDV